MIPGVSRSVLFIAVTAEESGLIGSEYYAEQPLVPLEKTAAVINIDAIQPLGRAKDVEVDRLRRFKSGGLARDGGKVAATHADTGSAAGGGILLPLGSLQFRQGGGPGALHQVRHAVAGQARWHGQGDGRRLQRDPVSQAGDEYSESWDVSGSIEDLRLLFEVGARVANAETWPEWRAGNEFAADAREERGQEPQARGRMTPFSPRAAADESAAGWS